MQHCLRSMIGYGIQATDGDLGKVDDFYFDDETWTIHYMIAETGSWLSERKVLVSLFVLKKPQWETKTFLVNLTTVQVRNSPNIDTKRPVYRQHEIKLHEFYQWPQYWPGVYGGTFGITPQPLFEMPLLHEVNVSERDDNPHLRSVRQVADYHIHATDGEIGHVEDFIIDDKKWVIHYLVVDIGNWLPGRKVLISPKKIKNVNWADASVYLNLSRESVKNCPEFEPSRIIHRDY
jgi:sporulation protein YlmC with PRC-barrel domain